MHHLVHHRKQRPVGEGSFHEARIQSFSDRASSSLTYVYDCGAWAKYRGALHREIDDYTAGEDPIDLLFLSHAHVDHINGVERLCKALSVHTVVMPLMEPTERLMAFAHAEANLGVDPADLAFVQRFTINPVATLAGLGVARVIQVGNTAGDGNPDDAPSDDRPPDDDVVPLPLPEGTDAQFPTAWELEGRGTVTGTAQGGIAVITMPDTVHFVVPATRGVTPWVLVTHVDAPIRGRSVQFLQELELKLGLASGALPKMLGKQDFVRDLVINQRRLLAKCYKTAIKASDLNLTSLSLYSGPDRPDKPVADHHAPSSTWWSMAWSRGNERRRWVSRRSSRCPQVGWLGTGDAALKQAVRHTPFLAHFTPYSQGVQTMTLPHHGSIENYSDALLTGLGPGICVAPADVYRSWQHPSPVVMTAVAQRSFPAQVSAVPESQLSEWVECIVY